MIELYGIVNCDTVRKARAWFAERKIEVAFHDYKRGGVPQDALDRWIDTLGWQALVNRQGTTWRQLEPAEQAAIVDAASARALMRAHPSVIKRPVVEWGDGATTAGFDAGDFLARL